MQRLLPGLSAGVLLVVLAFAALTVLGGFSAVHSAESCGVASWYGPGFHGKTAASGERFNQNAMTAAHKSLPFGTKLRVTHKGKSVTVRINDRGPFVKGRVLDLSKAAATKLGLRQPGTGCVCWRRIK